ncbi:M20 family metallopeptidase [Microbacterium saperdae]|uniref:Hippurate hydrolase n=1 Tax=Microbacterium saperdae TaxID=69368 RepID=A0A543BL81_9MICO|nr:M20 family metallopeptidase [Microbacterium saperdae]TQL85595.1 hippurate hydrolase [Microbacterium saperdae]GGM62392.1 amidohydrolase [Microbacterium saperdae]
MKPRDISDRLTASMRHWRQELHRRAEIGLDLPRTRRYVREVLEDIGVDIISTDDDLFVTAVISGGDGPTVLLRADMDALPLDEAPGADCFADAPGVMHACGHDAHTAMLLGAAHILCEKRDTLQGTVRLVFQPGEEGHGGAALMVDAGICDGIDAAFALHVAPQLPVGCLAGRPGTQMASSTPFELVVRGAGGHGSTAGTRETPLLGAARLALELADVDEQPESSGFVLSVTLLTTGSASNVISDSAVIRGTIRAHSTTGEEAGRAALERVVTTTAGVDVNWSGPYAPVLVNDAVVFADAAAVADQITEGRFLQMPEPLTSSEDFALIADRVPSALLFIGAGSPEASPVHTSQFRLDDDCLAVGAAMHASFASRLLS